MKISYSQIFICLVSILPMTMLLPGCKEEAPKADSPQRTADRGQAGSNDATSDDQGEFIPSPDELAAVPGRYRLVINPISDGPRSHFLLDTATGQVWAGAIPKVQNMFEQMREAVMEWVPVKIVPSPAIVLPEPGRFSIDSSYSYGIDKFLLDSISGRVWVCLIDDKQNWVFVEQTVHKATASPAAPVEVDQKAPVAEKK